MSLFEFVHLKYELEEALQRKIDLVEYQTIKPRLKPILLREKLAILRKKEISESILMLFVIQQNYW